MWHWRKCLPELRNACIHQGSFPSVGRLISPKNPVIYVSRLRIDRGCIQVVNASRNRWRRHEGRARLPASHCHLSADTCGGGFFCAAPLYAVRKHMHFVSPRPAPHLPPPCARRRSLTCVHNTPLFIDMRFGTLPPGNIWNGVLGGNTLYCYEIPSAFTVAVVMNAITIPPFQIFPDRPGAYIVALLALSLRVVAIFLDFAPVPTTK